MFQRPVLRQLLAFGVEVAEGMQYLHKLKFIHRDLAARNCMLDDELHIKIADFGLCRDIYESGNYEPTNPLGRDLPIRWMAPEAIEKQEFKSAGDVVSHRSLVLVSYFLQITLAFSGVTGCSSGR